MTTANTFNGLCLALSMCMLAVGAVLPDTVDASNGSFHAAALQERTSPPGSPARSDDSLGRKPDSLSLAADTLSQPDTLLAAVDTTITRDSLSAELTSAEDTLAVLPQPPGQEALDAERARYKADFEHEQRSGLAIPKTAGAERVIEHVVPEGRVQKAVTESPEPPGPDRSERAVPAELQQARTQGEQQRNDDERRQERKRSAEEHEKQMREQPKPE